MFVKKKNRHVKFSSTATGSVETGTSLIFPLKMDSTNSTYYSAACDDAMQVQPALCLANKSSVLESHTTQRLSVPNLTVGE